MAYDKKNRRDPKKMQYVAPETPRTAKSKKMKEFTVSAKTAITDNDGVKRYPGEKIKLTEEQANHFANLGYLQLDLDFNDNEEELNRLRSELAELKRTAAVGAAPAGAEDIDLDAGEASEGTASDTIGGEPSDGDISSGDVQTDGTSGRGRRKVSL